MQKSATIMLKMQLRGDGLKHDYWWKMYYQELISGVPTNSSNPPNTKLEDLKKARAELDAKIKLLETQG